MVKEIIRIPTKDAELIFGITDEGKFTQLHFGKKIVEKISCDETNCLEPFEYYPMNGRGNFNQPAVDIVFPDGSSIGDFRYVSHKTVRDKPMINGLPTSRGDKDQTINIVLKEKIHDVYLKIFVTAYKEENIFSQSIQIVNRMDDPVVIERALSLHLSLPDNDYDLLTLTGSWGREVQDEWARLRRGIQGVDSKQGITGHGQNPFIALRKASIAHCLDEVYGFNLIYSGDFLSQVEVDAQDHTFIQTGLNGAHFSWYLEPDQVFSTPEAIFSYSANGLQQLSQQFHQFIEKFILPETFSKKVRPILLNNWEATYFDFTREKILDLAKVSAELGIEMLVLDDGWFGQRADDTSSLGDWQPNEAKLGGTLQSLISEIESMGIDFGLWIELEMVSKNSALYNEHPEWVIASPYREAVEIRHQYMLDLSQECVQDHLIQTISQLLANHAIKYMKWDMNRSMTDRFSQGLSTLQQRELGHRYVLGLYRVFSEITQAFPDVLFEGCCSGGGRFDLGILSYMPQIWASDNTDAIDRLRIQSNLAIAYPPSTISCHVSAVPNHQTNRYTSLDTRVNVASFGTLGYELDVTQLTLAERTEVRKQIERYKKHKEVYQFGCHFQLKPFFDQQQVAWQKLSKDGKTVIVTITNRLGRIQSTNRLLKLVELDPQAIYQVGNRQYSGSFLMIKGLPIGTVSRDFASDSFILSKVDE